MPLLTEAKNPDGSNSNGNNIFIMLYLAICVLKGA